MIPTFVQQVIGVVVRAAIVWIAAWVAAHGGPQYGESEIAKVVAEATPVILVIVWSIWQKFKSRQKLMVAMASPSAVSENHLDLHVASVQPPSVLTPRREVPTIHGPK